MEAWLSKQWQRNGPWQIFLRPVSWLFGLLAALRRGAYRIDLLKSQSVNARVIIVGNINVGGTGKTPLVLALTEVLTQQGKSCGVVTRGYGGRSGHAAGTVFQIPPTAAEAVIVSDEAALLARRAGVPVYAGVNRVEAARALLREHPAVDVIISDDGLQHYALQRDIEICVIDGARGLGNGELLPAGPLREPESRLRSVDAIVVNRSGAISAASEDEKLYSPTTPTFNMTLANEQFVNLKTGACLDVADAVAAFVGKRILAVAGTGHPPRFFSHLASLDMAAATTQPFPDHHNYVASDFSGKAADIVLMTEKDAVKCVNFADDRMWFMRVDAVLPADFTEFILQKLSDRKA